MSIKDIDPLAEQIAPGMYRIVNVPKPHSAFELYSVQVGKQTGLCFIKAVGIDISTSSYGTELEVEFDRMVERLTKSYGKAEVTNYVVPNGLWSERRYFMMAMIKQERYLLANWEGEQGSNLKGNIMQVGLVADALDTDKGYLILEYYFSNKPACKEEITGQEDEVL